MKIHQITDDFVTICKEIIMENKSKEEWAEIESDDMFQKGNYIGGFDATEDEFCFSVYLDNNEYSFQVSLENISQIAKKIITEIKIKRVNNC